MTISKTQTMRPAEIALIDTVNENLNTIATINADIERISAETDVLTGKVDTAEINIAGIETSVTTAQSDISTLQTSVTTAQSDISTLQTSVSTAQSDITTLQTNVSTAQSDISTLQTNVTTAQSDISTLQTSVTNSTTLETINYIDNISPSNNVTISNAVLNRIGRICMLHVEFNLATEMNPLMQLNIFDIVGPYKPLTGCPASINGAGATAIINNTGTLWIKTFNTTYTGSHYMDCIYIHR